MFTDVDKVVSRKAKLKRLLGPRRVVILGFPASCWPRPALGLWLLTDPAASQWGTCNDFSLIWKCQGSFIYFRWRNMSFPKSTAQGNPTSAPAWKAVIGWRSSHGGMEQSLFCVLSLISVASFGIAGWGDFELLIYKTNISSGKNHLGSKCQSNFCWKQVSLGEVSARTLKTSRLWGPGLKDSGFPQACASEFTCFPSASS